MLKILGHKGAASSSSSSDTLTKKDRKNITVAIETLKKFQTLGNAIFEEKKIRGKVEVLQKCGYLVDSSLPQLIDAFYQALNSLNTEQKFKLGLALSSYGGIISPKIKMAGEAIFEAVSSLEVKN